MLNALQRAAITHLTVAEFSPESTRLSDAKWCALVGVSESTLKRWKRDAEFRETLLRRIEQLQSCADPFSLIAREFALEQMVERYEKERGIEKRQYLKLILDNTVHVANDVERIDYDALTDDELLALAHDREIPVPVADTLPDSEPVEEVSEGPSERTLARKAALGEL